MGHLHYLQSSEASQRERREAERMKGITQQRILEKRVEKENKEAIKEEWVCLVARDISLCVMYAV